MNGAAKQTLAFFHCCLLLINRGKKKLEKSLLQAKEEVQTLAEKLLGVQTGI